MKIPLSKPDIGEREVECVMRVLRSGRLSLGPAVEEFESRLAAYAGRRYAIATNSGTSALHLCVKALGIGPEDEALTTSFSFVASSNCLLYERALPSFVDIEPATLNIDPVAIRDVLASDYVWRRALHRMVNRRSGRILKAILPVHIFGLPCEMQSILEIAQEFNLHVIEDACEAIGAEYYGRPVGTFGDVAVFAFYPNKQITSGEGGMIVTDDARIAELCRSLRNQGRDEESAWLRHAHLGYNYRLSGLHSALGLAQLERIDELLSARARVAAMYSRNLRSIPGLAVPGDFPGLTRSWFVYPVQLRGASAGLRDRIIDELRGRGIATQAYFPAIHLQPYFANIELVPRRPLPNTEIASATCLALPFFSSMTASEIDHVCASLCEVLADKDLAGLNVHHARAHAFAQGGH